MSARKRTFQRAIIIAVLPAVLLSFYCMGAIASELTLRPSAEVILPGDIFTVDVFVAPDTGITGMQLDLVFDASKVRIENVEEGSLFKQSGMDTVFSKGIIEDDLLKDVYGCILGDETVSTAATFATVTFSLDTQASDSLTLDLSNVILSDQAGNALETVSTGIIIEIQDNSPPQRPGDFNSDGVVDFYDFVWFAGSYNSRAGDANYEPFFDFDKDGDVDFYDFVEFAALYGQ
ncbi:cohesin domain-containing protein [Methanolobus sp. WCC5]|uniref:cohesin domain-containing protein n=1 Tax=Methanolobus sp. WCC5 TaxID=3125785 RepID=UPI00324DABE2